MSNAVRSATPGRLFSARRLISIDDLSDDDIEFILTRAEDYAGYLRRSAPAPRRLAGKTQINLFFEDSTRTNLSFELAGKKLGADVLNVPVAASSVNKGESLIDTTQTLAAMGADILIVRAREANIHERLDERLDCVIVNAGDGAREHPTQALLDAASLRREIGALAGKTIAIVGDIRHSRVAGSNAKLLSRLGANLRFVGPPEFLPDRDEFPAIERGHDLKAGLDGADAAMALRVQFERFAGEETRFTADQERAYFDAFGLTHQTMAHAKPGARVLHPGPMNRGVEICGDLADDPERSLILRQVFYSVPTRMACLDALLTKGE